MSQIARGRFVVGYGEVDGRHSRRADCYRADGNVYFLKHVFCCWHCHTTCHSTTPHPVWPDLATFCHLGKSLQVFGKFLTVYFLIGIILSPPGQTCDIIWLIFIVANGQILKKNRTIWSHCPHPMKRRQGGGILLLGYSMICVSGLTIFDYQWVGENDHILFSQTHDFHA